MVPFTIISVPMILKCCSFTRFSQESGSLNETKRASEHF
jgi:hypothetical protein